MQEAYPFTVKPKGEAKDKWDMLVLGDAVPAASAAARNHLPDQRAKPLQHEGVDSPASGACGARRRHGAPAHDRRGAASV